MPDRQVGVEEEFLLVAESGASLRSTDDSGIAGFQREFKREQIEINGPPCLDLDELSEQLHSERTQLASRMAAHGVGIAALGTSPLPIRPTLTRNGRYLAMADEYGALAREQLSNGCHIHVEIESREEGVGILDRIRPWLSLITALSANSPFWQGEDTGYASYRTMVWGRWPTAGPTELFGSVDAYDRAISELVQSAGALDLGMIYFDARLSTHAPTVEIRVADVCISTEDATMIAGLCRGLVETAAQEWRQGVPASAVRTELLRAAAWRAARYGMSQQLIDPIVRRPVPAWEMVEQLLNYIRPALREYDDEGLVVHSLRRLKERGVGADLQRASLLRRGHMPDVMLDAMRRTIGEPIVVTNGGLVDLRQRSRWGVKKIRR